jgi:DNA-binding LacI/PurR family transcriptional regulator
MKKKNTYSLASISETLGVSKASVSLVLNGKARSGGISTELEERILYFCRKVNYRPNIHAQRINSNQVKNIGVLVEAIGGLDELTPFAEYNISNVIGGIASAADEAGYRFSMQMYKKGMDENKVFDWFESKEIDGLIYYGFKMPEHWRKIFFKEKYSVVGVSINPDYGVPSINIDNVAASFDLTEYLIKEKGYKNFLYLAGLKGSYPGEQRLKGFKKALKKHKIKFSELSLIYADFNCDIAEKKINERMKNNKLKEDCIVCANDNMAIGAIRSLKDNDISVPDMIGVVGADNMKIGKFINPALTTFDYLPYQQGRAAFELLIQSINGKCKKKNLLLDTPIIVRDSA